MDTRIEMIFHEAVAKDNSFNEKENFFTTLFGGINYSQAEVKGIWERGVKHGIEIGLNKAGLDGQKVELYKNTSDSNQKEFLDRFYELANKYHCAIQYHPEHGMVVIDQRIKP